MEIGNDSVCRINILRKSIYALNCSCFPGRSRSKGYFATDDIRFCSAWIPCKYERGKLISKTIGRTIGKGGIRSFYLSCYISGSGSGSRRTHVKRKGSHLKTTLGWGSIGTAQIQNPINSKVSNGQFVICASTTNGQIIVGNPDDSLGECGSIVHSAG